MKIESIGTELEWTNIGKSEYHHAVVDLCLKLTDFLPPYYDVKDFLEQKEQIRIQIYNLLATGILPNLNKEIDSEIKSEDRYEGESAMWLTLLPQSGGEVTKEGSTWISRHRIRLILNIKTKPKILSVIALRNAVNSEQIIGAIADTALWEIEKNITGKEPNSNCAPLSGVLN